MNKRVFGTLKSGETAFLYTIQSETLTAKITDYGAAPAALLVRDPAGGNMTDVMLGYDEVSGYEAGTSYMSALIGRFASRIEGACFALNGKTYHTVQNEGCNTLHSGNYGYSKRLWRVDEKTAADRQITFLLNSPDGDQGFPGNAELSVTYSVTDSGEFHIVYEAVCDQDTPLNLTSHAYFNLNGHNAGDVLSHSVRIPAELFTPVRADCIPTGEIRSVKGTAFDFTEEKEIGRDLDLQTGEEQIRLTGGYDHNYCLAVLSDAGAAIHSGQADSSREEGLATVLEARGDRSGICMTVKTSQPGFLFYTGNNLEQEAGKGGAVYPRWGGFCVETGHYPNSISQPGFPSPVLRAGARYRAETVLCFR